MSFKHDAVLTQCSQTQIVVAIITFSKLAGQAGNHVVQPSLLTRKCQTHQDMTQAQCGMIWAPGPTWDIQQSPLLQQK